MIQKNKLPAAPRAEEMREEDIYTEEGVSAYSDDDEINPIEEGFMRGYLAS